MSGELTAEQVRNLLQLAADAIGLAIEEGVALGSDAATWRTAAQAAATAHRELTDAINALRSGGAPDTAILRRACAAEGDGTDASWCEVCDEAQASGPDGLCTPCRATSVVMYSQCPPLADEAATSPRRRPDDVR